MPLFFSLMLLLMTMSVLSVRYSMSVKSASRCLQYWAPDMSGLVPYRSKHLAVRILAPMCAPVGGSPSGQNLAEAGEHAPWIPWRDTALGDRNIYQRREPQNGFSLQMFAIAPVGRGWKLIVNV